MIQKIRIRGFRSLKDVTWAPSHLNAVIGPSGAGKSNLLRALSLLHRSAEGALPRDIMDLGGITPLLWDGQAQPIDWTLKAEPVKSGGGEQPLTYELSLRQVGKSSAYRVEHELLGDYRLMESGAKPGPMKYLERNPRHAVTFDLKKKELVAAEGSVPEDQTLLSLIRGPFAGNPILPAFRERLAAWGIYHDLHVDQDAPVRQAALSRMERQVAPDGQNLIQVLHTLYTDPASREFKDEVDNAMRAAFGDDFDGLSFPPAQDQRIQLRLSWRSLRTSQSAADLSDGTIRFLLLLAILASPSADGLIAIDEPETGLHPSMLPIVAEFARQASTRSQVILTTHSPQFLDAFGDHPPTTTVARWCDGETKLTVLDGDKLARWLKEYTLGTLFRSNELESMA